MSEIVLSAIFSMISDKLASAASASLEKLTPYNEIDPSEIVKLQWSLIQIQDLLLDASQKEITNRSVKRWLNDLQHLAYDIDDLLDGLATDAMHRELTDEEETRPVKVRKILSTLSKYNPLRSIMPKSNKLTDITTKLEALVRDKASLGLIEIQKEEARPKNNNRRFQTSVVDPSRIVGRQAEKEALLQQLLLPADEPCDQNYSIVPILGMGGVGKTTLARLLYNDVQVKDHFELKAWVCVSDEFDSFAISKVIFQSMAGVNKAFADLNLLQEDLVNHLRGKRFLLVLDDVWSERREEWEFLVKPFYTCAHGSKIIITTRKDKLLKNLGYNPLNKQLKSLSYDDALSLFAVHALGVRNFDSHLSLKPHGEGIVKKCNGLPLALIALGTSLTIKEDEDSWKEVLESEIWKLPVEDEIILALRLSYHDLSGPLKQLFAYCSLFPKDFLFDKEELVMLWIAEGFLHQPTRSDSTEEHLGHEFFDELLSRSFFQHAPNNESLFVMHDLMNDLATSVSPEFFLRLDNENEKNIRKDMLEKYRHMSFVREEYVGYKKFEAFESAKSLRTFLATSVGEVKSWASFYLSNKILTSLLGEFGKMQNATYAHEANFSQKKLSELELVWSDELHDSRNEMLEKEVLNELKPCYDKLIQLEIRSYGGLKFPNWVGDHSFLHLKHVSIRGCKRCTSLPPLGQLPSLKKLDIEGLYGVETVGFELSGTGQAFPSLEILSFDDMRGWKKWSGAVFPRLQKLEIKNCPNLVEVTLEALPSLNVLEIEDCPNLVEVTLEALPSLSYLKLDNCDSGVLRRLVEVASAVIKLDIKEISGLNDVVWRGVIEYLGAVEELSIRRCKEIRYVVKSDADASKILVTLRKLEVCKCDNLESIGEKEEEGDNCRSNLLISLRTLYVSHCKKMERCSCPDGIEELTLESCSSMTVVSFPNGGQEKLKRLTIYNCRKRTEAACPCLNI
ncbi:putative P-loop containing nucleoside triphosphate hydrolase, leucine-rich repeat domain superfamily [Helianthus annuus]|nr:putative P-loop containing nucleoside triphosphate hydrolase, leucine-rich repeat domain superfamily [Helianthus annuus]